MMFTGFGGSETSRLKSEHQFFQFFIEQIWYHSV